MTAHPFPVARRLNAERIVLFGWSRAILLQLAQPRIAAAVEHSSFRAGPVAAAKRLHHTVKAMLALTFGTDAEREQALAGIRAIHRRVPGAEDPELVLWVHLTLLDSIPLIYERLVGPLTATERDAYCEESSYVAIQLGAVPSQVPRDAGSARVAFEAALTSQLLAVGDTARALADAVLAPPLTRLIATGTLPPPVREQYRFAWSARDEARLQRAERWLRRVRHLAPDRIALWRPARR